MIRMQPKTIIGVLANNGFQVDQTTGNPRGYSSTLYRHRQLPVEAELYYTSGELDASNSSIDAYGVLMRNTQNPMPLLITSSADALDAWCSKELEKTDEIVEFWKDKIVIK
jgi:hypothetical protein